MGNRQYLNAIFCFLIIILSVQAPRAQNTECPDSSKIGVNDGDRFSYVVLDTVIEGFFTITTPENKNDWPEKGTKFTLIVLNATPGLNEKGNLSLKADIDMNGVLTQTLVSLYIGNRITFTDWDYWEAYLDGRTSDRFLYYEGLPPFVVINGAEVFKARVEYTERFTDSNPEGIVHQLEEFHYDKHTGTLLYYALLIEIIAEGDGFGTLAIAYHQKNYGEFEHFSIHSTQEEQSENSNLISQITPGFDFLLVFTVLIATITLIKYKKH